MKHLADNTPIGKIETRIIRENNCKRKVSHHNNYAISKECHLNVSIQKIKKTEIRNQNSISSLPVDCRWVVVLLEVSLKAFLFHSNIDVAELVHMFLVSSADMHCFM
jgi:hypothetical protein